jgi:hypothetical protein
MSESEIEWQGIWDGPIKGKNTERVDGYTPKDCKGKRFVTPSYRIVKIRRGNWNLVSRTRHRSFKEAQAHAEQLEVNQ